MSSAVLLRPASPERKDETTTMKSNDRYLGGNDPFEGNRTLWLRSLPSGARVTRAIATLAPGEPSDGTPFVNFSINYSETGIGDWGATRDPAVLDNPTYWTTADLHARRTVSAVVASHEIDQGTVTVQMDIGGTWVGVASDGTILTSDKQPLVLKLPAKPTSGPPSPTSLPLLTTEKIKLTAVTIDVQGNVTVNTEGTVTLYGLTIRSVPTNVSVRLGQMPPFWTRLGELVGAETSPEFTTVLNAFLEDATAENGFYAIPFVIHSDTLARLNVTLAIDYIIEQPILPPYLSEVTLPYGYSSLPGIEEDLLTVKLPREAKPVAGTGGAVQGAFDASRVVLGEIGETGATATATVSPERALAQPIQILAETPVNGIDLPLANTQPGVAGLHLALQADADGKPSGEVLTSAEVTVEKPAPGGSAWGSAALPTQFRFLPGERYWLVLQSVSGEAYWNVRPGDPATALQASADGSFSWHTAATNAGEKPLVALFRLRYTPERFGVPLQLQIGKGPDAVRMRFDRFAPLGRVEFDVDFATELGEYLALPAAASPCGDGELLTNGSFDEPPHTDATRRLFGFDAGGGWELKGMVDLSRQVNLAVQRFVHLSVDGGETIRIDCAGTNPSHTGLKEIIDAINQVIGDDIASEYVIKKDEIHTGRLYLLSPKGDDGSVVLHAWRQAESPQGWQKPSEAGGEIWRFKLPTISYANLSNGLEVLPPECVIAALEAEGDKAAVLSQSLPVAGGCAYVLRFLFQSGLQTNDETLDEFLVTLFPVLDESELEAPSWEVRWLDTEDRLINSESEKLGTRNRVPSYIDGMRQSEARLVAPSGAAQAEIRFIQPPPGVLFLDNVSFTPTSEVLCNGNFQQWEVESGDQLSPAGWTRLSGWLDPELDETGQVVGAKLRGGGPEDAVLVQTAEVISGESYELRVRARPVFLPADDAETRPLEQRVRLELHWLADDAAIGKPVILPLDGRDFPTRAWKGTAPDRTIQAEIRLIQPQGGDDLLVGSVSLSRSDLVSVPLIFLAEAPGELTISDLRVAYDYESPGLSQPTTPVAPR